MSLPPPDPATLVHDRFTASMAPTGVSVSGSPSPEELAAVMAAVEHLWPKPVVLLPSGKDRATPTWRFSGRWWSRPSVTRRDRPWVG